MDVLTKMEEQKVTVMAARADKAKMQLKMIHIQSDGNDDKFH